MLLIVVFMLGVGNFAMHRAVIDSGHPLLGSLGTDVSRGRLILLALEFGVLLAAMLLVYQGHTGWAWAYLLYTMLNALSAWLILSNRL